MPSFYASIAVRREFELLMQKLDRARTGDTKLKILMEADNLLRSHRFGWDAVFLRPGRNYQPRSAARATNGALVAQYQGVVRSKSPSGVATPAPSPEPAPAPPQEEAPVQTPVQLEPLVVPPLVPVSQETVVKEAKRITMSAEGRNNLRSLLRLSPHYIDYVLTKHRRVESWSKHEMVQAALEFGIDLTSLRITTTVVTQPPQPKQLDIEDAIKDAKAVLPPPTPSATEIDSDPLSIEYKSYAKELAEKETATEAQRRYFRLLSLLNRSLNADERDKITDAYCS